MVTIMNPTYKVEGGDGDAFQGTVTIDGTDKHITLSPTWTATSGSNVSMYSIELDYYTSYTNNIARSFSVVAKSNAAVVLSKARNFISNNLSSMLTAENFNQLLRDEITFTGTGSGVILIRFYLSIGGDHSNGEYCYTNVNNSQLFVRIEIIDGSINSINVMDGNTGNSALSFEATMARTPMSGNMFSTLTLNSDIEPNNVYVWARFADALSTTNRFFAGKL